MFPLDEVNLAAKVSDLKEDLYQNALLLTALTELLVEKGILSHAEVQERISRLDRQLLATLYERAQHLSLEAEERSERSSSGPKAHPFG